MSEKIVRCGGCGKQYRIPPDAVVPEFATFECVVCSTRVPYGHGDPQRAPAAAPVPAASPRRRGRKGRRAATVVSAARGKQARAPAQLLDPEAVAAARKKANQNMQMIGAISIVVLLALAVILYKMLPESRPPMQKVAEAHSRDWSDAKAPGTTPTPPAPAANPTPAPPPKPEPTKRAIANYIDLSKLDGDLLFREVADVAGTSEAQRAQYDKDIALLVKRDTARAGVDARGRLLAAGRPAIPALLDVFGKQWHGEKWTTPDEKFACYTVQQLLIEIVKADAPTDFVARFDDENLPAPPADFERAARMWVNWWNTRGKNIESFRKFED